MERNVTIYTFWDDQHKAACEATVAAFGTKGCALDVMTVSLDDCKRLMAEGFKDLPVLKLEREGESWEGHLPDRIAAYQPRLSEFKLEFKRARGPTLGVWRNSA